MTVGQLAGFADVRFGHRIDAAFALHQFENDARGAVAHHLFERGEVIARDEAHPGHQRLKIAPVTFLARNRQRADGAPVEGVVQGHDFKFVRRDTRGRELSPF